MYSNFLFMLFVSTASATAGIILLTSSGLFGVYTVETIRRTLPLRSKPAGTIAA